MDARRLEVTLGPVVSVALAKDLVAQFLQIRQDYATKTLERASPGKFVEAFVQCLQHLARGSYDVAPKVDEFLGKQVEAITSLPDGLRICAARIARSIYTLRNKRNIAHKNEVDPNTFDLAFVHHGSSWIMAELIRNATGTSMEEAGKLIELVQLPVDDLVEEIDGVRLVHARVNIKHEAMILLRSHHPHRVSLAAVKQSLSRRNAGTLGNQIRELVEEKLVDGSPDRGYRLTQPGFRIDH
jgi:hypothetical protein